MRVIELDGSNTSEAAQRLITHLAKPPKLIIGVMQESTVVTFTLSVPLPREHSARVFQYAGQAITEGGVVLRPKVGLCQTPQIRQFLHGLTAERRLEVNGLSLSHVEVRYDGSHTGYRKTVDGFAAVCIPTYGIEDGDMIAILPLSA